jgi:CheY-like chemotaxis protein
MQQIYTFKFVIFDIMIGKHTFWLPLKGSFIQSYRLLPFDKGIAYFFFAALMQKLRQLTENAGEIVPGYQLNILIVDDDDDDRLLLEEAISSIGPAFQIDFARSGMELTEKINNQPPPELVFLDLNMPGKTGKECLSDIRHHDYWTDIPVIIYSTSANRLDIQDTYLYGANLYLLKPNSFTELTNMIRHAFSLDLNQTPRLSQKDFLLTPMQLYERNRDKQ